MITITKQHFVNTVLRLCGFSLLYGGVTTLLKPLCVIPLISFIVGLAGVIAFAVIVVLPVWGHITHDDPSKDPLTRAVQEFSDAEEARKQAQARMAQVPAATEAIRASFLADIRTCLADAGLFWMWGDFYTVSRLYLYTNENGGGKAYSAIIHFCGQRIDYIDATIDGIKKRFLNEPYLIEQRIVAEHLNAPVVDFIATTVPDATWMWDNVEDNTIILSSVKFGLEQARTQLTIQKDGRVSSVSAERPGQSPRRIYAKKGTGHHQVPTAGSGPITKSVEAQARNRADVIETNDMAAPELLKPTDIPPVDMEVLRLNAEGLATYMWPELDTLATEAADAGEQQLVIPWPEGLQTETEVNLFITVLVEKGGFTKGESNTAAQTISLSLL